MAIAGVVLAHVAGWGSEAVHSGAIDVALSGTEWTVPAFFAVSGFLWGRRPHSFVDVRKIWARILVPYLIWSIFYFAFEWAVGLQPSVRGAGLLAVVFAGQTSWHLWFLPALAGCQLVALVVRTRPAHWVLAGVGLVALAAEFSFPGVPDRLSLLLDGTFLTGLAAFFGGVLLAGHPARALPTGIARALWVVALVATCVVPLVMPVPGVPGGPIMVAAMMVLALVPVADAARGQDSFGLARLGSLGRLAFGVYLLHMIPVDVLRLYGAEAVVGLPTMLAAWIAVLLVSFALSAALRRTRWGRVILGEPATRLTVAATTPAETHEPDPNASLEEPRR